MKIFQCNPNIKSYKFPVLKIIICCLIITLIISRGYFIHINNSLLNITVSVVCFQIGILSILCIYLSISEMLLLYERRTTAKIDIEKAKKYSKFYSIEQTLTLLKENDIIEFFILSDDQVFKLGASSDSKPGNAQYFNKTYYADDLNYLSIDEVVKHLNSHSINGQVHILTIDGVPPL